jgi:predicted nucleic acid-binding protein
MILDTNAVSDLLEGNERLAALLAPDLRHHLPIMVMGEYRFGLLGSRRGERLEPLIDQLESESRVLSPDVETARIYAQVRRQLKRAGTPIPENDIWIASLSIQHRLPIASRDDHFDRVEGVDRLDW